MAQKVLFLDRDGVINKDVSYLYKIEDLQWMPGIFEGLALAQAEGYKIIVITNQSGVARGYYTEEDVKRLHDHMQAVCAEKGITIDAFYYCPHHPEGIVAEYRKACSCRKPEPGLFLQAFTDFAIDREHSVMIGDSKRDVEAAEKVGIHGVLFTTGRIDDCIRKALEGEV